MMQFNILFAVVTNLTFVVEFPISVNETYQDFFLFNGVEESAHFFRNNATFSLFIEQGENQSLYELSSSSESVIFSWERFMINGEEMKHVRAVGNVKNNNFHSYSFMSPLTSVHFDDSIQVKPLMKNSLNYWYIVAIIFIGGFILETTGVSLKAISDYRRRGANEIMAVLDDVQKVQHALSNRDNGNNLNNYKNLLESRV